MPFPLDISLIFLLGLVNAHALWISLSPLTLPLALAGICGIQNLAAETPVVTNSCVLGQDSCITRFPDITPFSNMQSQAQCLGQSLDNFQYLSLFVFLIGV